MGIYLDPPYNPDNEDDDRVFVDCDHCERTMEDRDGHRLGKDFICGTCYYRHPVIVGELAAVLAADERRDDDCPF